MRDDGGKCVVGQCLQKADLNIFMMKPSMKKLQIENRNKINMSSFAKSQFHSFPLLIVEQKHDPSKLNWYLSFPDVPLPNPLTN